jgi:ankyrin repeat protein
MCIATRFGITPGCSHWRVLHAAASIPSPPQFIRSAIMLFPWQVKERDENGYLPLHRAAMCIRNEGIDENQYWLNKGVNQKPIYFRLFPENRSEDNPITIFVKSYPDGAKALDYNNRLPLHWALETGKKWHEGVKSLVIAAPFALSTRDSTYRIYPFMMAAMRGDVENTFHLLLENPMMVHSGILEIKEQPRVRKKIRLECCS